MFDTTSRLDTIFSLIPLVTIFPSKHIAKVVEGKKCCSYIKTTQDSLIWKVVSISHIPGDWPWHSVSWCSQQGGVGSWLESVISKVCSSLIDSLMWNGLWSQVTTLYKPSPCVFSHVSVIIWVWPCFWWWPWGSRLHKIFAPHQILHIPFGKARFIM